MVFLKRALVICCSLLFLTAEAGASEVMLKIASLEATVLDTFRGSQMQFLRNANAIDYRALTASLASSGSGSDAVQSASIPGIRRVPAALRDTPPVLQALYPEQGRIIGRQMPGSTSGWHKFMVDFSDTANVIFIEFGVDSAVLDSLASGFSSAALRDREIQQYTQGSSRVPYAVFTAGYSFFVQQIAQGNAHEWLENLMPMKNGVGIVALRRTGSETRTDTLMLRIDPRYVPQNISGKKEVLIILGWDRL